LAPVSGNALAVFLSVLAGLAGAVQVAMMSQLGDRIGVAGALAFAMVFSAVAACLILLGAERSLHPLVDALHQPKWMLLGGVMGLLVVFTITYAGSRIGVAATVGILIAGQLVAGAAIDRWGLFGSETIPLDPYRLTGIVLLGLGAALSLKR
jgi:bacterial/archaeal transporter family-2 protein